MCQRSSEARAVEQAMLDVSHHLCKQKRADGGFSYCPLYDVCGYQRQKNQRADIWFGAHELMTHEKPTALGDIGWLLIDESPLDAFLFGINPLERVELPLDELRQPADWLDDEYDRLTVEQQQHTLYRVLHKLKLRADDSVALPTDDLPYGLRS